MRNYSKAALAEGKWHKVTVERGIDEHRRMYEWLNDRLPADTFMYKPVTLGHHLERRGMIFMFSNLEDFVLARLMFDFTSKELKGCTDWARVHTQNAEAWLRRNHYKAWQFLQQNPDYKRKRKKRVR